MPEINFGPIAKIVPEIKKGLLTKTMPKMKIKTYIIHVIAVAVIILACLVEWQIAEKVYTPKPVEVDYDELSSWEVLQLAIIKTESDYDPWAIGKSGDLGILQITPIYVKEVNRLQDSLVFYHNDAFSIDKSIQMFNIYQRYKNPEKDIEKAIRCHNPGGDTIGYANRVMSNYRQVLATEEVRKQIKLHKQW